MKAIDELIEKIEKIKTFISRHDGEIIDLNKEQMFTPTFLHTTTPNITEQESAEFERDNKKVFDFLLSLNEELLTILRN